MPKFSSLYYEYVFTAMLFFAITTVLAIAYGWASVAGSTAVGLCGLLMVALRAERT